MPENSLFLNSMESPPARWQRWGASAAIHVILIGALLAVPVARQQVPVLPAHEAVHLYFPRTDPPPPAVKVRPARPIPLPPVKVPAARVPLAVVKPVIVPHTPTPVLAEPPKIEIARAEPKLEQPRVAAAPPSFSPVMPAATPVPGPRAVAVKTGVFGGDDVPAPGSRPATRVVQSGGFDQPASSASHGTDGLAKVVAVGQFGSSGTWEGGGAAPDRPAVVRPSGFGDHTAPANPSASAKPASVKPSTTPVEIISKPNPAYTAEARERKVEGEVQLEVLFSASGKIQVLGVVHGLGMGLDESARTAATRIRFHPGTKDGNPVDMRGIVHIVFKLS